MAERSKACGSGPYPKGRGFEPHWSQNILPFRPANPLVPRPLGRHPPRHHLGGPAAIVVREVMHPALPSHAVRGQPGGAQAASWCPPCRSCLPQPAIWSSRCGTGGHNVGPAAMHTRAHTRRKPGHRVLRQPAGGHPASLRAAVCRPGLLQQHHCSRSPALGDVQQAGRRWGQPSSACGGCMICGRCPHSQVPRIHGSQRHTQRPRCPCGSTGQGERGAAATRPAGDSALVTTRTAAGNQLPCTCPRGQRLLASALP